MPHWAYFQDHPGEFNSRVNQVSMFASGWLDREMKSTGKSAPELIVNQIWRAVLLPFYTQPGGWYINNRPFTGVPMALAVAIGLAITTVGFWRREFLALAVAYWALAIGLGLTEDPTQTQRLVVAASLMAILAAIAIVAVVRIVRRVARAPGIVAGALAALALVGLMAWNVNYYFFAPREARLYGDGNSYTATQLAYYLRDLPPGQTVYFLGPPRMFYYGFQTLPFIARNVKGIDVERPISPGTQPPPPAGPTVFVALPERTQELRLIQTWYPRGNIKEVRVEPEGLIFTAYELPAS
jgi:hypothetical protein